MNVARRAIQLGAAIWLLLAWQAGTVDAAGPRGERRPEPAPQYSRQRVYHDGAVYQAAYQEPDPFADEPQGIGPMIEPAAPGAVAEGVVEDANFFPIDESMHADAPAPAISSRDWLKNGPWYTQQSAVYMDRSANVKNSVILSRELVLIEHYAPFLQIPLSFGYQPGLRSTLGRRIGRDCRNRDHSMEFTFLGLTHWQASEGLSAAIPGAIITDIEIDPTLTTPIFNGANTQTFAASSSFNSYELNYRIDRRLPRDRVIYTRDSTWVRQAEPANLPGLMAGLRVVINNETFNWLSEASDGTGTYEVVTHNNLVGPQVGIDWFYERTDWRVGVRGKAGALVNWADSSSNVRIVDTNGDTILDRNENPEDHLLSFVGELNFIGVYHLRPHFALRVSYDLMWVTNQALAQNQVTFAPSVPPVISAGHPLFYQGVSFGFELVR